MSSTSCRPIGARTVWPGMPKASTSSPASGFFGRHCCTDFDYCKTKCQYIIGALCTFVKIENTFRGISARAHRATRGFRRAPRHRAYKSISTHAAAIALLLAGGCCTRESTAADMHMVQNLHQVLYFGTSSPTRIASSYSAV